MKLLGTMLLLGTALVFSAGCNRTERSAPVSIQGKDVGDGPRVVEPKGTVGDTHVSDPNAKDQGGTKPSIPADPK